MQGGRAHTDVHHLLLFPQLKQWMAGEGHARACVECRITTSAPHMRIRCRPRTLLFPTFLSASSIQPGKASLPEGPVFSMGSSGLGPLPPRPRPAGLLAAAVT